MKIISLKQFPLESICCYYLLSMSEINKLPRGFENEWSRRLVEGGDEYMLRNLNYVYVRTYISNNSFKSIQNVVKHEIIKMVIYKVLICKNI